MGQYAESNTLVAVELTMKQLRVWLVANKNKYKDSKYPSTPAGEFELVSDWANHYDITSSIKPFASIDYDDQTFGTIYMGSLIASTGISTGVEDGSETHSKDFTKLTNRSSKLQALFPKKKLKIVTMVTVG